MNPWKLPRRVLPSLAILSSMLLLACQQQNETSVSNSSSRETSETISTTDTVSSIPPSLAHVREDDRQNAYQAFSSDGSSSAAFPSLYRAIRSCVDSGGLGGYVLPVGESNKDHWLFSASAYSGEDDVFFGYNSATRLDAMDVWRSTYFSDPSMAGDLSVIHYNVKEGLSSFHSSYAFANVNSENYPTTAGKINLWDTNHNLDSYLSVMPPRYSGITRETYSLSLSQARIAPSYAASDPTRAFIGFSTSDDNYLCSEGILCDTSTGDWHYYSGFCRQPLVDLTIDDEILFTSNWDEEAKCFTPSQDVNLSEETLMKSDGNGNQSPVHQLTITLANGVTYSREFSHPVLSMAGSIAFVAGLDIVDQDGSSVQKSCPDLMNGSYFKNLVITKAQGSVVEGMRNNIYGQVMLLAKGDYDLLSSSGQNKAKLQSVLVNSEADSYLFKDDRDVYSFSYDNLPSKETYSDRLLQVNTLIAALPKDPSEVTLEDTAAIYKAQKAYDALPLQGEKNLIQDYARLSNDAEALESL